MLCLNSVTFTINVFFVCLFFFWVWGEFEDKALVCIYFVNVTFLHVSFHSISHSTHRTFGKQQWQQLHDSLTSWKANLAAVKSSLQALSPSA